MTTIRKRCSNKECRKQFRTTDKRKKYCTECKPTSKANRKELERKQKAKVCIRCGKPTSKGAIFEGKKRICEECQLENNSIVLTVYYKAERYGTTCCLPEWGDVLNLIEEVRNQNKFCYVLTFTEEQQEKLGLKKRAFYMPGDVHLCHAVSFKAGGKLQKENIFPWPAKDNQGFKEDHSRVLEPLINTLGEVTPQSVNREMRVRFGDKWLKLIKSGKIKAAASKNWKKEIEPAIGKVFTTKEQAVKDVIAKGGKLYKDGSRKAFFDAYIQKELMSYWQLVNHRFDYGVPVLDLPHEVLGFQNEEGQPVKWAEKEWTVAIHRENAQRYIELVA
ncbi:hypothetical protein [uncultured Endozoicomonas sp.]|uniref:hypothetical protein n=1 Tax=uncultured Endozoicomonas sp. TaxID=432652 RepID=UPI00260ABAE4|nr:hypothetical protein [uncultured Endozoicomonas sp.]